MGATGAVGREIIEVLHDRNFPVEELRLFASERSAGKIIDTPFGAITIENADMADYSQLNIAFFAISGDWSKENADKATSAGCYVIDNSSAFRYDDEVPLVVPEINANAIGDSKLIANPNCTTAIAAIPLYALHKEYGLKKVIISTYQATSGAGAAGMSELTEETKNYLEGKEVKNKIFPDNPDGQIINVPDDSTYEDLLNIMDINQELVILLNDGKAVPIDDIVVEGTVTILKAISGG